MHDAFCCWIDIFSKSDDYMIELNAWDIKDSRVKRNVTASIRRMIEDNQVAVLHFSNSDIAVVNVNDFGYNVQLQRALQQVYDNILKLDLENLSNDIRYELKKKVEKIVRILHKLIQIQYKLLDEEI